ncbi:PKD domain-containing protein [Pedobacter sp. P351]|uniref:PKD domain-containing protein n=1 Tax=Pedobacter superstes TaxID=3133441 RepID=UPI0030AFD1D9
MFLRRQLTLLFFFFFLSSLNQFAFSQSNSNKGTDFWVTYTGHIDGGTGANRSRLTLFITSETNAIVNINAGGVQLTPISLLANQAQAIVLDPSIYTNIYIGSNNVIEANKGIHVSSDNPIVVYSHISRNARSAATLIFPTKALGNEYYSINYNQSNGNFSEFTLVGVEDNTQIEITPKQANVGNVRPADVPFQITLNKGDVYQYQSSTDLTGSLIRTLNGCRPLAVFSGSSFTAFCEDNSTRNPGSGDNLYQQLLPISAWGKKFVSAPFYNTVNGNTDIYRIIVSKDNTTIKVNNSTTSANGTPLSNPYAKGSIVTFFSNSSNVVEADNPISLTQFQTTQACNLNNVGNSPTYPGDPEMTVLNPIEQTLTDVILYSAVSTTAAPTNITKHYINIIIKTADAPTLKIDGMTFPLSQFVPVNSEYSYLIHDVTASSLINPTHRVTAGGGFVAIAYGYGNVESYAYLAGSDLKNLNQFIQVENPVTQQLLSNGCVNQPYNVSLVLPYITNSLSWDLGNGISRSYTNPAYTTVTSNGVQAYSYQYPETAEAVYTSSGKKTLSTTSINPAPAGCDATETIKLFLDIYDLPIAQFSMDKPTVCLGTAITLNDNSTGSGIKKWNWDFGDGITESRLTSVPFTHVYTNAGDYGVKLVVESDMNCSSLVFSQDVHISQNPSADFIFSNIFCENQPVTFTDKSLSAEGNIIKWTWDFDGVIQSRTSANAFQYVFNSVGTKKLRLQVSTDLGCVSDWKEYAILIRPKPLVDFNIPDFCLNDAVANFTNTSTIADGTESQFSYKWNFGEPVSGTANTSINKNGSHIYQSSGDYLVSLTVTSNSGCDTTLVKPFTVNGSIPKADFIVPNENNLCSNQAVVFEDKASVDFGQITRIEWDFDVNSTDPNTKLVDNSPNLRSSQSKLYTYLYPSFNSPVNINKTIRMKAYSGGSCVDSLDKVITLKAVPRADFELKEQCLPDGVATFLDKSLKASGNLSYKWDFGDQNSNSQTSNTSAQQNPRHQYSQAGIYLVTLITFGEEGCADTIKKTVEILGSMPVADFNVLNGNTICSSEPVTFEDQTTLAFGEVTKIEWQFDANNHPNDPQFSLIDNSPNIRNGPMKKYVFQYPIFHSPATQLVEIKMLAYSGTTCVAEIKKQITLKAVPEVVFKPITALCENASPYQIIETDELHGFTGIGVYSGNAVSATGLFNPRLAGKGTHIINYSFSASNNCTDTKTQTITVFEAPTVNAGEDLRVLQGSGVQVNAYATGVNLSYIWSPAIGLSRTDIANPVASPSDDVTYTLTVTTSEGCSVSDEVFIKVLKPLEIPNTFTPNSDGVNDVWNIKYLENYPGCTVDIFNRYGTKVFSTLGYSQVWDGKSNGTDLPVGTYYYVINPQNGRKVVKGSITLLR